MMDEMDEEEPSYSITDPVTGKPSMCAEMCVTCIFRPDSPVTKGLRRGRLRQLIADTRRRESYIVCHSTFNAQPAICRGFYDRYSTNLLRILERLGGFTMIQPPKEKP
jgi:hypothetical protein